MPDHARAANETNLGFVVADPSKPIVLRQSPMGFVVVFLRSCLLSMWLWVALIVSIDSLTGIQGTPAFDWVMLATGLPVAGFLLCRITQLRVVVTSEAVIVHEMHQTFAVPLADLVGIDHRNKFNLYEGRIRTVTGQRRRFLACDPTLLRSALGWPERPAESSNRTSVRWTRLGAR